MKIIQVRVKPGARVSSFEPSSDGTWVACVKAPPVDGKANRELVALVARHFGLRNAQVCVKAASGRVKLVRIDGYSP